MNMQEWWDNFRVVKYLYLEYQKEEERQKEQKKYLK